MRHLEMINTIVDLISTHNSRTIKREICIATLSDPDNQTRKQALVITKKFLEKTSFLPSTEQESVNRLNALYEFFLEESSIENHQLLAVSAFFLRLNTLNAIIRDRASIILFGRAFLDAPMKFAAFICWLLDHRVTSSDIIESDLLIQYCHYNIFELDTLAQTYTLIRHFSDHTHPFLKTLEKKPCHCRGMMNNPKGGRFESYNVMGMVFQHAAQFHLRILSFNADYHFERMPFNAENAVIFYDLLGFELIKCLFKRPFNTNRQFKDIISALLFSEKKISILTEFPMKALSGELSSEMTTALLDVIAVSYGCSTHLESNAYTNALLALETDVFYVHAFSSLLHLPAAENAVTRLSTETKYKTQQHIPLLVSLVKKFQEKNDDHGEQKILQMISDIMISVGDHIPDDIEEHIETISDSLISFFEKIHTSLTENINHEMKMVVDGQIEYYQLQNTWSSQLSTMNLIKYFFSDIARTKSYPYDIYVLKINFILAVFHDATQQEKRFCLASVLTSFSDDCRVCMCLLQKLFRATDIIKLKFDIVDFSYLNYTGEQALTFFHTPFEKNLSFFEWCLRETDEHFLSYSLDVIPNTENDRFNAMKKGLTRYEPIIKHLIQSRYFTEALAFETISYLFSDECKNTNGIHQENYFLEWLIEKIPYGCYSPRIINCITQNIIETPEKNSFYHLCKNPHDEAFPENFTSDTVSALVAHQDFEMVLFFCGLTEHESNSTIIQKNNVALFLTALESVVTVPVSPQQHDIIRTYAYHIFENGNTLFHLVAQSGHHATVKRAIHFFEKYFCKEAMYMFLCSENAEHKKPNCPTELSEAGRINTYLTQRRNALARNNNAVPTGGGLWHFREDRSRKRERDLTDELGDDCDYLLNLGHNP